MVVHVGPVYLRKRIYQYNLENIGGFSRNIACQIMSMCYISGNTIRRQILELKEKYFHILFNFRTRTSLSRIYKIRENQFHKTRVTILVRSQLNLEFYICYKAEMFHSTCTRVVQRYIFLRYTFLISGMAILQIIVVFTVYSVQILLISHINLGAQLFVAIQGSSKL